jgi:stage II sporulation protein AB (anti-sigma F factor)
MGHDSPDVRLLAPALPANVALIRHTLAGVLERLPLRPERRNEIQVAVTEAATNAVVHAYGGGEGPLEMTATARAPWLVVSIRDAGRGIHPAAHREHGDPTVGFGLPFIETLSDAMRVEGGPGGTTVDLAFALEGEERGEQPAWPGAGGTLPASAPGRVELALGPHHDRGAIAGRTLALLAARAHFPVDRLAEARELAATLVRSMNDRMPREVIDVEVDEREGGLEVRVGPVIPGRMNGLLTAAGERIGRLAGGRARVERSAEGEHLVLRLEGGEEEPGGGRAGV